MRRRKFIGLVCGALAWPAAARAQVNCVRRIGVPMAPTADDQEALARALIRQGRYCNWLPISSRLIERHPSGEGFRDSQ
jgi:hypothetical protein